MAERGDGGGQAESHQRDEDGDAQLGPGDIEQPGAGAVPQTVGNDNRHGRPGNDDDQEARGEIGAVKLKRHGRLRNRGTGSLKGYHGSGGRQNRRTKEKLQPASHARCLWRPTGACEGREETALNLIADTYAHMGTSLTAFPSRSSRLRVKRF